MIRISDNFYFNPENCVFYQDADGNNPAPTAGNNPRILRLTKTERKVFQKIWDNTIHNRFFTTAEELGNLLFVTENTIRGHVSRINFKFNGMYEPVPRENRVLLGSPDGAGYYFRQDILNALIDYVPNAEPVPSAGLHDWVNGLCINCAEDLPDYPLYTEPIVSDTFRRNLYQLDFDDHPSVWANYHELLPPGSPLYVEGDNLNIEFTDWSPKDDIPALCTHINFETKKQRELAEAARRGYSSHPDKICLDHFIQMRDDPFTLTLSFGRNGYIEQRVLREEISRDPVKKAQFEKTFCQSADNNSELHQCPWANAGGGVWLITTDGYLVVSFRRQLGEVLRQLSYSSSGSYDYFHDKMRYTPAKSMAREMDEELGIRIDNLKELKLANFGIDTERYLIQLSYRWDCHYTSQELMDLRAGTLRDPTGNARGARDQDEFNVIFVKWEKPLIQTLLSRFKLEPGAAASLYQLMLETFQ